MCFTQLSGRVKEGKLGIAYGDFRYGSCVRAIFEETSHVQLKIV